MCAVSITGLPSLRFLGTGDTSEHGHVISDDASDATVRLAIPSTTTTTSTTSNAVAGGDTIHTTAHHPWLTADRGWVQSGQLHVGEPVVTLTGSSSTVAWVHVVPGTY